MSILLAWPNRDEEWSGSKGGKPIHISLYPESMIRAQIRRDFVGSGSRLTQNRAEILR